MLTGDGSSWAGSFGDDSMEPGGRNILYVLQFAGVSHLRSLHYVPISQLWQLKLGEAKQLAPCHTAQQRQDSYEESDL